MHKQPVYLKNFSKQFENKIARLSRKGLYLPLGIHLDKKQEFIVKIVEHIKINSRITLSGTRLLCLKTMVKIKGIHVFFY